MGTHLHTQERVWNRNDGISKRKLQLIANAVLTQYRNAGGDKNISLDPERIRGALNDMVRSALSAQEALHDGLIPDALLGLLPDDEARFELSCLNALPSVPDITDEQSPRTSYRQRTDRAPRPLAGYRFCPECGRGEVLIDGGKCNNCGEYIYP